MKKYVNEGDNTTYVLNKRLLFIKRVSKIKFFPIKYLSGSWKFYVHPHRDFDYFHWLIRLPYFYFERDNRGLYFGANNQFFLLERKRNNLEINDSSEEMTE